MNVESMLLLVILLVIASIASIALLGYYLKREFKREIRLFSEELIKKALPVAISEEDGAPSTVSPSDTDVPHATSSASHLERRLDELEKTTRRFADHIDKLHEDNEKLRADDRRRTLEPLMRSATEIVDTLDQFRASPMKNTGSAALNHIEDQLLSILNTWGVEDTSPLPGQPFDPRLHNGVGVIPTESKDADRTIAHIVRRGFSFDGKFLRRSDVEVYKNNA